MKTQSIIALFQSEYPELCALFANNRACSEATYLGFWVIWSTQSRKNFLQSVFFRFRLNIIRGWKQIVVNYKEL